MRGSAGGQKRALIEKLEAEERLAQYIKTPNLCLNCKQPILPKGNQKLSEVKQKKFCGHTCSASYNNKHRTITKRKTPSPKYSYSRKLSLYTDDEIIDCYNKSNNLKEFVRRLGYNGSYGQSTLPVAFISKCEKLNLDLDKFTKLSEEDILCLTKGEIFKSKGYQKARSTICKHARVTYQKSDKPKCCIVCKYDRHYEVSHVKAVSEFDDNALLSEINDLSNLVALCPNHHWEYDNGLLDLHNYSQ